MPMSVVQLNTGVDPTTGARTGKGPGTDASFITEMKRKRLEAIVTKTDYSYSTGGLAPGTAKMFQDFPKSRGFTTGPVVSMLLSRGMYKNFQNMN
jgi:hypothetical protein|uniref:Uncharacterized protein n=1 Tax=viral metagenome TaxID=1070528 RepID=A0A6C0AI35_9ZZZZ